MCVTLMKDTDIWNVCSGNISNWIPPDKAFQMGTVRIHELSGDLIVNKIYDLLNGKLTVIVMSLKQMWARRSFKILRK